MESDYHKVSPIAVLCARARAGYTAMPYAKEIYTQLGKDIKRSAKDILSPWLIYLCLRIPQFKVMVSIFEGRYHSTGKAIRKLGSDVGILELASGLSGRGLEMAQKAPFYIESDLEDMIAHKEKITRVIRDSEDSKDLSSHYFRAINPVYEGSLKQAAQIMQDYSSRIPLAVVHEGFFLYLNRPERESVRNNIRDFLVQYNPQGVWISPDFSPRPKDLGMIMRFIRRRIAQKTGRDFYCFSSDEEAGQFLAEGGLDVEFLPNEDIIEDLSCIDILRLDPGKVREYARSYRAAFITLR